ncbi:MAG: tRNA pseudouridine(38-40) synthase TruA [Candidatus Kryptoniota bacterium]
MRNIALLIEYDGTAYGGWQVQKNSCSIQEILEKELSELLREKIKITGAGRTDAGVHACGQVANFHIHSNPVKIHSNAVDEQAAYLEPAKIAYALNGILPRDIAIRKAAYVQDDFHSRFDAKARRYFYSIITRKSPVTRHFAALFYYNLSIDLMNEAATILIGEKSFKSFTKYAEQQRHFICRVSKAEWTGLAKDSDFGKTDKFGSPDFIFHIEADRFLHGMVRAIVGTLIDVGRGKISVGDFRKILTSENRSMASMSAPACGLCLEEVKYEPDIWDKL